MNKKEFIETYGEEAYQKMLEQNRQWQRDNPVKRRKNYEEQGRKGGKYYLKKQKYEHTGLQGQRHKIRVKHGQKWREYKKIIAPNSVIHHSWRDGTAEYAGVALVERNAHQHRIIDVIQILDGEITLLTEREGKSTYIGLNQKAYIL